MPFAFIIVGLVLVVAGVRGQSAQLLTLVKGDLTGKNNYLYWVVAIIVIGSVGYVDELRGLSRAFLALVIIGLILRNGGFATAFNNALAAISTNNASSTVTAS